MKTYTVRVDEYGTIRWYKEGTNILHREGDLPAIEYRDCGKVWYQDGKCHRETGPAIEHSGGRKEWSLDGIIYTETGFNAENARRKAAKSATCDGKVVEIDGKKYRLVVKE